MDWLSIAATSAPAIISAIFAAMAASQNKSARRAAAKVAPTVSAIVTAIPGILDAVRNAPPPSKKKIDADMQAITDAIAAPGIGAAPPVPIDALQVLAQIAALIEANTLVLKTLAEQREKTP